MGEFKSTEILREPCGEELYVMNIENNKSLCGSKEEKLLYSSTVICIKAWTVLSIEVISPG